MGQIDQHDPFETPRIAEVVERLDPRHVVFEFVWRDMAQWEAKIATQKKALNSCSWPASRGPWSSSGSSCAVATCSAASAAEL
jgi:hypothetical protein